jgi:glycosyltransferase involved in cell wall biosynthesis
MSDRRDAPRVLLVVNSLGIGGTERMIERLVLALHGDGRVRYTVLSLETPGPIGARLQAAGVPVVALGRRGAVAQVLSGTGAVRRFIRGGGFDLVHSFLYRSHTACRLARLLSGRAVPVVSSERCLGDNRGLVARLVNRMTARGSDRVLAVSRAVGERAAQRDGVPAERVAVVPNGVEIPSPDTRSRRRLRRALGLSEDQTLFLALGRLHREKGPDLLLRALAILQERGVGGWRCAFVGDGPERGALVAAAASLGDRVIFPGSRRRVAPWLLASDVLVLPSREEGMPVAPIEAMMRGRMVVATRVGGTPEVVRHDETGLLVPPEDPKALAAAIEAALRDPARRAAMGARGLVVARAEFTLEAMTAATLGEYRRLLDAEPRAATPARAAAAYRR